jgi:hypothetical protein
MRQEAARRQEWRNYGASKDEFTERRRPVATPQVRLARKVRAAIEAIAPQEVRSPSRDIWSPSHKPNPAGHRVDETPDGDDVNRRMTPVQRAERPQRDAVVAMERDCERCTRTPTGFRRSRIRRRRDRMALVQRAERPKRDAVLTVGPEYDQIRRRARMTLWEGSHPNARRGCGGGTALLRTDSASSVDHAAGGGAGPGAAWSVAGAAGPRTESSAFRPDDARGLARP